MPTKPVSFALVALLAATSLATRAHAQAYVVDNYASLTQTNLTTTSVEPGYTLWTIYLNYTNNASTAADLYLALDGAEVTTNNTNAPWSQSDLAFEVGGLKVIPQPSFYVANTPQEIDFTPPASSGFAPGDSIPFYTVGTVAPGATVSGSISYEITSSVTQSYESGYVVSANKTPEPGAIGLLAAGLLSAAGPGYRRFVSRLLRKG